MTYHSKIIPGGKIAIPADLRREFGLKDGDSVVLRRDGEKITLQSDQALMRELRAKVKAGLKRPLTLMATLRKSVPRRIRNELYARCCGGAGGFA